MFTLLRRYENGFPLRPTYRVAQNLYRLYLGLEPADQAFFRQKGLATHMPNTRDNCTRILYVGIKYSMCHVICACSHHYIF